MSNRAITWAYQQTVKAGPKFVLVTLADMADQEHSCFPGVTELARLTGFGRTAVMKHIEGLIADGLISKERRARKDGARSSNRYYLDVDGALTSQNQSPESGHGDQEPKSGIRTPLSLESEQPKSGIRTGILEPPVNPKNEPPVVNGDAEQLALIAEAPATNNDFDTFWSLWPRRDGKKAALAAWLKAIKRAPAVAIIGAAQAYATSPWRPDRQFVPHASTWLNGDRWTDPLPEPPEQRAAPPVRHPSVQAGLDLVRQFDHTGAHDEPAGDRQALGAGHNPGPHHPHR